MPKVLLLTRYDRQGASSRLRFLQYLPYLESRGLLMTRQALFDDGYLERKYAGERSDPMRIVGSMARRLTMLLRSHQFDLLWMEAELFPFLPAVAESRLNVPYVVDYDDAVFHRYDRHTSTFVQRVLGRKIDAVMRGAALVVAGNEYLASHARLAGARRVEILPTAVDLEQYPVIARNPAAPFTIGWIGTPITSRFLRDVEVALAGERLLAIGASDLALAGVTVDSRPWSENTEAQEIACFDVGIMPLPDNDWERGKCGYKLIQYMACGRPVVASPVGVNKDLVSDGVNGFLATTAEEWRSALEKLKKNAHLREEMGERGRQLVESRYCTAVTAPRLEELLRSAIV